MKKLNILIVEDEPLIAATIEVALRKQNFNITGVAENYTEAIENIQLLKPNLVLIDIQLNGAKDGVDLAIALDKKNLAYMYLSSQTDPNTIARVKLTNPLGYIVKPFTENGLSTNIELAWHRYEETQQNFLTIKHEGRLVKVNENCISYLKAYDNYCYVITKSNKFLIPNTLKKVSEKLKSANFIKTHRSYYVNVNHITTIEKNTILIVNQMIPISASQKKLVLERVKNV